MKILNYDVKDIWNTQIIFEESYIYVWKADIQEHINYFDKYKHFLTLEEKKIMEKYVHLKDQQRFLIGHAILRILLSRNMCVHPLEIEILKDTKGKPYLPESDLFFNISHSGDIVMIAFSKKFPIGIDVEEINNIEDYLQLAKNFFLPNEYQCIFLKKSKKERLSNFYRIWTVKEAFVKALGLGLHKSLKSFEVFENEILKDYPQSNLYTYHSAYIGNKYVYSVVVVNNGGI